MPFTFKICNCSYNERMRSSFAKLRWGTVALAGIMLAGSWGTGFWSGLHAVSAAQSQQPAIPPLQPPFGSPEPNDPMEHQRLAKMEKARNADRQKQLVQDTDKLLALAKELKDEVGKSNADTLSIDVVKKASEIEKLAKNVKDRMRG
jgi:hypothetical protein